jgi:chromate transporter
MKDVLNLFVVFMKMGAVTFGGGYAMMPVLEREIINKRHWVTTDEVMEYYTIAQITPGIIAVNVSTFVGNKRAGIPGGIAATLGFIFLPVCMVIAIGLCLTNFAHLPVVRHAFAGIRLAVGALILQTVVKMAKGALKGKAGRDTLIALGIVVAAFIMSSVYSANPVILVIAFGLAGFVLYRPREK